jgi:NAD-dependent dihydropyrimidine dehydrogenase PreA subunit
MASEDDKRGNDLPEPETPELTSEASAATPATPTSHHDEAAEQPEPNPQPEAAAEARRPVAVVDRRRCSLCGFCVPACVMGAMKITDRVVVDERECIACGLCIAQCPNFAIHLEPVDPA